MTFVTLIVTAVEWSQLHECIPPLLPLTLHRNRLSPILENNAKN